MKTKELADNLKKKISIIDCLLICLLTCFLPVFRLVNKTNPNLPIIIVRPFIENWRGDLVSMVIYVFITPLFSLFLKNEYFKNLDCTKEIFYLILKNVAVFFSSPPSIFFVISNIHTQIMKKTNV